MDVPRSITIYSPFRINSRVYKDVSVCIMTQIAVGIISLSATLQIERMALLCMSMNVRAARVWMQAGVIYVYIYIECLTTITHLSAVSVTLMYPQH